MKKIIFVTALMLSGLAFNANASVLVTTTCGTKVITVSEDYFQDYNEYYDYLLELNSIECGPNSGGVIRVN